MSPEVEAVQQALQKAASALLIGTAELEDDIVVLHECVARAQAELMRRLSELDESGLPKEKGFRSTTAWAADKTTGTPQAAARALGVQKALKGKLPLMAELFADGVVGYDHAKVAADTVRGLPESAWAAADQILAEAAVKVHANDLRAVGDAIRTAADREKGRETAAERHDKRRLSLSPLLNGMWSLTGLLEAVDAEAVRVALDACTTKDPVDLPARSPSQRRADALGEAMRRLLSTGSLPEQGGERPQVVLTCNVDTLSDPEAGTPADPDIPARDAAQAGADGGLPVWPFAARPTPLRINQLDRTGTVSPDQARRLSCDAAVVRVLLAGRSEVLDVGRKTRVVPAALRRAIVVRDRHCRWPGCDAGQAWSDVHHVRHWAHGGATDQANCLLLCTQHHDACHDGRWTVTLHDPGHITVRRRRRASQPLFEITDDLLSTPPPDQDRPPDRQ